MNECLKSERELHVLSRFFDTRYRINGNFPLQQPLSESFYRKPPLSYLTWSNDEPYGSLLKNSRGIVTRTDVADAVAYVSSDETTTKTSDAPSVTTAPKQESSPTDLQLELQAPDTEGDLPEYIPGPINENISNIETSVQQMDETIQLSRKNCNLEILVPEAEDRKIRFLFDETQIATSGGQCQITVQGGGDAMLALYISRVQLSGSSAFCHGEEVLRVVLANAGVNYTFKEYCGNEEHYPVLLTETDKAYVLLTFYPSRGPRQRQIGSSSFNMEMFTYHKQSALHSGSNTTSAQLVYPASTNPDADNIYFTTIQPEEPKP